MDTNIQSAMAMMQAAPLPSANPALKRDPAAMAKTAKEFESVFVSQFLGSMFSGIQADATFGGGQGEDMFRSLMVDQYAKSITERGGFGLAAAIQAQMMKMEGGNTKAAAP
jgi:Rod binding domain-containing protein